MCASARVDHLFPPFPNAIRHQRVTTDKVNSSSSMFVTRRLVGANILSVVLIFHCCLHVASFTFGFKASANDKRTTSMSERNEINSNKGTLLLSNMHKIGPESSIQLILASASPRRREILDMMGLSDRYTVQPSPLDEKAVQIELSGRGLEPKEYAKVLAEKKAAALCNELLKQPEHIGTTLILGSDTIVDHQGHILEKPTDTKDAYDMLARLSGRWHVVHTGVAVYALVDNKKKMDLLFSFTDTAKVKFAPLTQNDIKSYVSTGEPMDKAGSYGIQGIGGQIVESLEGDFFTVMGLPMHELSKNLNEAISGLGL